MKVHCHPTQFLNSSSNILSFNSKITKSSASLQFTIILKLNQLQISSLYKEQNQNPSILLHTLLKHKIETHHTIAAYSIFTLFLQLKNSTSIPHNKMASILIPSFKKMLNISVSTNWLRTLVTFFHVAHSRALNSTRY